MSEGRHHLSWINTRRCKHCSRTCLTSSTSVHLVSGNSPTSLCFYPLSIASQIAISVIALVPPTLLKKTLILSLYILKRYPPRSINWDTFYQNGTFFHIIAIKIHFSNSKWFETIYLNLCQLSRCLAISHISQHMFDVSYFSRVFFLSFKIILLFNIIDFF